MRIRRPSSVLRVRERIKKQENIEHYKHKCFISYSYGADGKLAPAFQSGLRRINKPWHRFEAMPVFLDKTDLPLTPALWPSIEKAMSESEYFLLLASRQAAVSPWVQREVEYWLGNRSSNSLFIILTDGELRWDIPNEDFVWNDLTPLPTSLRKAYKLEPKWLDLRWARTPEEMSLRHPQFYDAIAEIASTLQNVEKKILVGEDVKQHRKARRLAWSAIVALVALFLASGSAAVFAAYQMNKAVDAGLNESLARMDAQHSLKEETKARQGAETALIAEKIAQEQAEEKRKEASRQRLLAESQRREAIAQRDTAVSRELAANATLQMSIDPELGQILATKAVEIKATDQAVSAVRRSLTTRFLVLHSDQGIILGANYSRDGRYLATAGYNKAVIIWDVTSGRKLHEFKDLQTIIKTVEFSPDGKYLAGLGADKTAWVWETRTGRLLPVFGDTETRRIYSVSFIPDGKHLLGQGNSGLAWLWDVETASDVKTFTNVIPDISFSPDGKYAVSAQNDGLVVISETLTGKEVAVLRGHKKIISSITFSENGNYVLTSSADGSSRVWETLTGNPVSTLVRLSGPARFSLDGEHISTVTEAKAQLWHHKTNKVAFEITQPDTDARYATISPNGRYIALPQKTNHSIVVWDALTGKTVSVLEGSELSSSIATFNKDGKYISTLSSDGTAQVWETLTGNKIAVFLGHKRRIHTAMFSPDNKHVVTIAEGEDPPRIWDLSTELSPIVLQGHKYPMSVQFSQDMQQVFTLTADAIVQIWDRQSGKPLTTLNNSIFSAGGKYILTSNPDGSARVYETLTGITISTIHGLDQELTRYQFSAGMKHIFGVSGRKARVWSVETGEMILDVPILERAKLSFDRDEKYVFCQNDYGTGRVYDTLTRKVSRVLQVSSETAALSPDGEYIVEVKVGKEVIIHDLTTNSVKESKGHLGGNEAIRFSPDGKYFFAVGGDRSALIWETRTGEPLSVLRGHSEGIINGAFSPNSEYVVTASFDKTARVWETRTGDLLTVLRGHENWVSNAVFSRDGKHIITTCSDRAARVYHSEAWGSFRDTMEVASKRPKRELTSFEIAKYLSRSGDATERRYHRR